MTDPTSHPAADTVAPRPDPGNSQPDQWALNLRYVDTDLDALIADAADPHALDPLLAGIVNEGTV